MSAIEDLQKRLIDLFYLDPPPSAIGSQTLAAIENFKQVNNISTTASTEEVLEIANGYKPAELNYKTELVKNVINECNAQGFWLSRGVDAPNIVYIEGLNRNGTVNNNRINQWNDVRTLLVIEFNGYAYFTNIWECTVNSGLPYTENPLNPGGAANIVIPQQSYAWKVGKHVTKHNNQEALVQVRPVAVARDGNQDGRREGDRIEDYEVIGLNQHYGSGDEVGFWSAGCLVGSTREGHEIFMSKVKSDRRYRVNNDYTYGTIILNGYKVAIV